jgi:hypothetical protein
LKRGQANGEQRTRLRWNGKEGNGKEGQGTAKRVRGTAKRVRGNGKEATAKRVR